MGATIGTGVAVGTGLDVLVGDTGVAVPVVAGIAVFVANGVHAGLFVGMGAFVGMGVFVGVGLDTAVWEGMAVGTAQAEKPTLFESIVTAALRARALPDTLAPVSRVMLAKARILPTNVVFVPMVAELPTRQNTLQSVPPLIITTDELLAVVSVLPILKMKTASAWP